MTTASWPLLPEPFTPALPITDPPFTGDVAPGVAVEFVGFGLVRPFRRDLKSDFTNATGIRLVASALGQVLGTRAQSGTTQGELPWRTEFGSLVHLLRQRLNSVALVELARTHVVDAIRVWEPRVLIRSVTIVREPVLNQGKTKLSIKVGFDLKLRNGGAQVLSNLETSVPIGIVPTTV